MSLLNKKLMALMVVMSFMTIGMVSATGTSDGDIVVTVQEPDAGDNISISDFTSKLDYEYDVENTNADNDTDVDSVLTLEDESGNTVEIDDLDAFDLDPDTVEDFSGSFNNLDDLEIEDQWTMTVNVTAEEGYSTTDSVTFDVHSEGESDQLQQIILILIFVSVAFGLVNKIS